MKLFTKIISMMLVLAMLLSFAACSDGSSDKNGDNSKAESEAQESKEQDVGDKISSAMLTGTWTAEINYLDEFKAEDNNEMMTSVFAAMTEKYTAQVAFEFKADGTYNYYIVDTADFEEATNAFVTNYLQENYNYQFEQGWVEVTYEEWYELLSDKTPNQVMLEPDMLDRDGYWFYADGKIYLDNKISDTYFEITLEGDVLTFNKGVNTFTCIEDAHLPATFNKSK